MQSKKVNSLLSTIFAGFYNGYYKVHESINQKNYYPKYEN